MGGGDRPAGWLAGWWVGWLLCGVRGRAVAVGAGLALGLARAPSLDRWPRGVWSFRQLLIAIIGEAALKRSPAAQPGSGRKPLQQTAKHPGLGTPKRA